MADGKTAERIRVSCAALCRIEHDGRFLLLLNQARRANGLYQLSPLGGALELHDQAVLSRFEAVPEDATSNDLRLMMPPRSLSSFRQWFHSGAGRERSPFRELHEELVVEAGLLDELRAEDVVCDLWWTIEREAMTDRSGHTGALTHYFLEVYDVTFKSPPVLAQLLNASEQSGALWLTRNQITAHDTLMLHLDGEEREVHLRGRIVVLPPDAGDES